MGVASRSPPPETLRRNHTTISHSANQQEQQRPILGPFSFERANPAAEAAPALPQATLPSMHLLILPVFSATAPTEPVAIDVAMTMTSRSHQFQPQGLFLWLLLSFFGDVPSARYDSDTNPIATFDTDGRSLKPQAGVHRQGPRLWAEGLVHGQPRDGGQRPRASGRPLPRAVQEDGQRHPVRRGHGPPQRRLRDRLGRPGISFIPVPPSADEDEDADPAFGGDWNVTVEWGLRSAPAQSAVHGASSTRRSPPLAGPRSSWYPDWTAPPPPAGKHAAPGEFAVYWLEPAPFNVTALAVRSHINHARMASYFDAEDEPFRVFFRQVEAGYGGTGSTRSFLVEFSEESAGYADELSFEALLSHETAHEYAVLDEVPARKRNPRWPMDESVWYIESIAEWLSAVVGMNPDAFHRVGVVDAAAATGVLHGSSSCVLERYFDLVRVAYSRGFVFIAQLDGTIVRARNGLHCKGDVVLAVHSRQKEGIKCTIDDFKQLLAPRALAQKAWAASGPHGLMAPLRARPHDEGGKVVEVVPGSNGAGWCTDGRRARPPVGGREIDFQWIPRSSEVVEAYGWVDATA
ncbi:hypothetical protein DFJ73DRAFT_757729 [Zopfochytrium polystomum]|nr:hypothetical protein DFJ73DRAFT_757729 [Zopfochytrium polystomum]